MESATGLQMMEATLELLELWKLTDRVVGLVFDTTSSNTGVHRGAAILLEQKLTEARPGVSRILHLGCRHHVDELLTGTLRYPKIIWICN